MPGTNLTRDEATARAALLDVQSYAVDLDLTTSEKTFGSTTTIRFTCRQPGSGTFVDLVDATVHSITLNGRVARPRHGVRRQPDRADRPRRRQRAGRGRRLHLQPQRRGSAPVRGPGRRPGLPLQPVRGARRPPRLRHLRAARPQEPRSRSTSPRPTTGRWSPTRPTPEPEPASATARRSGTSRRPSGCRPTSPRSSPASTTRCATPTRARTAPSRWATTAASRWSSTSTSTSWCELTSQGFEFFEREFGYPYPFEKYDQLYVPEYNMGAMENAGCVTLRDEYLPRSRQDARVLRVPRLGDPPRDGAHVVRRPGDHEVVGRPLAQRVVRRVGLLPRRGRGDRVHRRLDRLHQRPQADRLPPGPAARAPTRSRPTTSTCTRSRSTST